MTSTSWVFWATPHTGTMETCNSPGVVQPMCEQFWYKVYWTQTSTTFIQCTMQGNIWNCRRLEGQPIFWNYIEMELRETPCGSRHASLCQKTTHKISHVAPLKPQHCPYVPNPIKYGKDNQAPFPLDKSLRLNKAQKKCIQQIVGSFLYYARAVDPTILMALS